MSGIGIPFEDVIGHLLNEVLQDGKQVFHELAICLLNLAELNRDFLRQLGEVEQ